MNVPLQVGEKVKVIGTGEFIGFDAVGRVRSIRDFGKKVEVEYSELGMSFLVVSRWVCRVYTYGRG